MDSLRNNLETLFGAFENEEAFDLDTHRDTIMRTLETVERQVQCMRERGDSFDDAIEENALFRHTLASDCRRRLIFLGDSNADQSAKEIETLTADELVMRREEVLERFDRRFNADSWPAQSRIPAGRESFYKSRPCKDVRVYRLH